MSVIRLQGNCLSSGESRLEIRDADEFALCLHDGSRQEVNIDYGVDNIKVDNHVVSVGGQHCVRVVEHLFSALYALNLFNVRIDLFGDEIPFFDGSSQEFVSVLKGLPNNPRSGIKLMKRILVNEGSSSILYSPLETDELYIEMSLTHAYVGNQNITLKIDAANYGKEIAAARTFVFTDENDPRLKEIPAYGIGITGKMTYSATPLRFADEPVRHKILDLLGDLYVLKKPIYGRIRGKNTSHHLNLQFVRKLCSAMDKHDA